MGVQPPSEAWNFTKCPIFGGWAYLAFLAAIHTTHHHDCHAHERKSSGH
jgi:hypothetical protein